METVQQAVRAITSKPVQRAVVNTLLAVIGALSLFCVAGLATALFFQNFVPDQVLSAPVHLQYGSGVHPYGIASLTKPAPKPAQEYDISLTLSLPRSPPNLDRGNFMVSIYLLDAASSPSLLSDASKFASASPHDHDFSVFPSAGFGPSRSVLFHSRRSALVPYVDPVISMASRVLFVFWHLMFPEKAQSCQLDVKLAERVAFPRLGGVPKSAYVEVEAGQTIQIYGASLTLTAQLSGLRYFMVHYRLPTYLLFTFLFWVFEVLFMTGAFVIFSASATPANSSDKQLQHPRAVADDQTETSDHPHTFPTYGKQPRLKHEPQQGIKREHDEEEEEEEKERLMAELPVAGTEADDEDDYDDDTEKRDSGIGTSYSEEGQHSVRRRTSRTLKD